MYCPFCLHEKTKVSNSRKTPRYNATWRRRTCLLCKQDFTTYETVDPSQILIVKDGPHKQPFSRPILLLSLARVLDHRRDNASFVLYIEATIETNLIQIGARQQQEITKQNIVATTLTVLKNGDTAAFVKYLTYYAPDINERQLKQLLKRAATF